MQDAAGNSVEFKYDRAGNMLQLIDAKGNITSTTYDAMDRPVRKAFSDGRFEAVTYNPVGQPAQVRTARGQIISYAYNDEGLLTNIDYPNQADIAVTYDSLRRVATTTDGLGESVYGYDALDRVTSINGPWVNDTVNYSYDSLGRSSALGINGTAIATYGYDGLSRLSTITGVAGVFNYNYVGNTELLAQQTNPNGTKSEYTYDNLDRLTQLANKTSTNANLSTFAYGFDAVNDPQRGVRTSLDKTIGSNPTQRLSYGYDTVDQLTGEVLSQGGAPQWSKSFAYDAMGNRTASQSMTSLDTVNNSYTSNKLNQVTAIAASWSGGANTLASSLLYDQSGNLTKWTSTGTGEATPAHTEYVYDDSERLIAVVKKNPTILANLSKSEFVYDGNSRLRISREYTWNDDAWVLVPNSEKRRVYDGMDVIQERDGTNAVIATYTRDGNIGGILAKRDAEGDDYFFHYDGSGNVVGLTDEDQNSVAEYAYDAYGNLLSSSGAQASNNLYRYSTKEHFTHAGLYNYGWRFYSSGLGRWINRDPIAEAGGLNVYGAFRNNPVSIRDAYGLSSQGLEDDDGDGIQNFEDTDRDYDDSAMDDFRRGDAGLGLLRVIPQRQAGGGGNFFAAIRAKCEAFFNRGGGSSNRGGVSSSKLNLGLANRGFRPPHGTRVLPPGVPKHWRISGTRDRGDVHYYDPNSYKKGDSVRVMPGKSTSPWPNSRAPYVVWTRNGQQLDMNGNPVSKHSSDAHIPLHLFIYK